MLAAKNPAESKDIITVKSATRFTRDCRLSNCAKLKHSQERNIGARHKSDNRLRLAVTIAGAVLEGFFETV